MKTSRAKTSLRQTWSTAWWHFTRGSATGGLEDLLADRLEAMPNKLTVGFKELETMKMFRSHQAIRTFLKHYSSVR